MQIRTCHLLRAIPYAFENKIESRNHCKIKCMSRTRKNATPWNQIPARRQGVEGGGGWGVRPTVLLCDGKRKSGWLFEPIPPLVREAFDCVFFGRGEQYCSFWAWDGRVDSFSRRKLTQRSLRNSNALRKGPRTSKSRALFLWAATVRHDSSCAFSVGRWGQDERQKQIPRLRSG